MSISFGQATERLLSGDELSWLASGAARAGSITLAEPGQRRLFSYLLGADPHHVAKGSDTLFDGLTTTWRDEDSDPTPNISETDPDVNDGPWRLHRIETTNFGGLNTYGGPLFALELGGEDWCLEGSNGSGKTLLASAIIWTLTGYRLREQDGLDLENGVRKPVYDDTGRKIGTWPPLATYPESVKDLKDTAAVNAKLVFSGPAGEQALASRTLVSPLDGNAEITPNIDSRLTTAPQLIEAGLLMPARLTHIGFGSKSASLYEAMQMLTGLDQLAIIALGAGAFSNKGRRFLKYAKDQGISRLKNSFGIDLGKAREFAENTQLTISENLVLGDKKLLETLQGLSDTASTEAGTLLALLESDIVEDIDLSSIEGRQRLSRAANSARDVVAQKTKGVPFFDAGAALDNALDDEAFTSLPGKLPDLESRLDAALGWHVKQLADEKLRLKALASRFFLPAEDLTVSATCPLCAQHLKTEDQRALAAELGALKANADAAERTIDDACSDIEKAGRDLLPQPIQDHFTKLVSMNPAADYGVAVRDRFVKPAPFSDVLVGIARSVEKQIVALAKSLPGFQHPPFDPPAKPEPGAAVALRSFIHGVRRIVALADWWADHRGVFVSAWLTLLGEANADGKSPSGSLEGMLKKLEEANDKAEPLDKIASHLRDAKKTATEWNDIHTEQRVREAIAEALEPLKDLKHLIDAETHRTIKSLSGRVGTTLEDIHLKERFAFGNAELEKRQVTVHGRFSRDYKIDAGLVANASWLRSVLWAFIFAMRDEAIQNQGGCSFPLMVLDDPQLTFDPKNKRKWAQKIVALANTDASEANGFQLFLTTHERQFFDIVTGTCGLDGQKGMIARPYGDAGVVQILNGSKLERVFAKAKADHSDDQGRHYVRDVRVYCEDLLRIMLRDESYELTTNTLGALTGLLTKYRKDNIPPFNRPPFKKLTDALNENTKNEIAYMNATSHTDDDTIGIAQANDVERYWSKTLEKCFSNAFMLAADYDAYGNDPRLYSYPKSVIEFPASRSNVISEANLLKTGIAAAAASDGIVGDGTISIEKWGSADPLNLHNHDAYRVSASTLEPVVTIGDVVLVRNYGEPNSRNLVVAAHGDHFVARRLNLSDDYPGMAILTGQSTNPYMLPQPIIVPVDKLPMRKIVGALFMPIGAPTPITPGDVVPVDDASTIANVLEGAQLFQVSGRSMEPIALEDQLVITRKETIAETTLRRLEGTLVIAIDENGAIYFKRLRRRDDLIILESANSDASTQPELLSLGDGDRPALANLLSVAGVLFEEP